MRISIVNPAPSIWIKRKSPPLGPAYIAAVLEHGGHQVQVIDFNLDRDEILPESDVVGITTTTGTITNAWRIAQAAKKRGAITVLGGPHATSLPDESLELECVDFVVRGEGERTVVELCRSLERGQPTAGIQGISYRDGGRSVHNPPRPLIDDLDALPFPALHLFPSLDKYTNSNPLLARSSRSAPIITSRGCPFSCIFCSKATFGRTWRPRSPRNVVAEWESLLKRFAPQEISILDDAFNVDIPRAIEICERVISEGLVVPWLLPNGMRADLVTEELLRIMKNSGCYRVAFGVESGSETILKTIGKSIRLSAVKEAFRLSKKVGLETFAFFIIGLPGENRETMEETIRFAIELEPDFAQFSTSTPLPGAPMFDMIRENGQILVHGWDQYNTNSNVGVFNYGEVTKQLVDEMTRKAYRRFYMRPRQLCKLARKPTIWKNLPSVAAGGMHYLLSLGNPRVPQQESIPPRS